MREEISLSKQIFLGLAEGSLTLSDKMIIHNTFAQVEEELSESDFRDVMGVIYGLLEQYSVDNETLLLPAFNQWLDKVEEAIKEKLKKRSS